jgi:hypothetical protein
MKAVITFLVLGSGLALQAQTNPMSTELKMSWDRLKGNIVRSVDKLPDDAFAFHPTPNMPEVKTLAQWVGHLIDGAARSCGQVKGEAKNLGAEKGMTTKAQLQAAMKEAFDLCDSVHASLTDAQAVEMVNNRTKISILWANVSHLNEGYGSLAVYMRLKGIVPASSEGRGGGGKKG